MSLYAVENIKSDANLLHEKHEPNESSELLLSLNSQRMHP
jgi:hypothetical protein